MEATAAPALRIVVDGPSGAGKTSTARALGERLSQPVQTPEEADGSTLLFDWMDYVGGRHEGKPIHTQLITVPGHLERRRMTILETADVVVFVANSASGAMAETEQAYQELQALRATQSDPPAVLVQANQRDAPDAVGLDELRSRLGIGPDELVIETVASEGEGVRQVFVYAVRLGLPRLDADAAPRRSADETAEDLERLLLEAELVPSTDGPATEEPVASSGEAVAGEPVASSDEVADGELERSDDAVLAELISMPRRARAASSATVGPATTSVLPPPPTPAPVVLPPPPASPTAGVDAEPRRRWFRRRPKADAPGDGARR